MARWRESIRHHCLASAVKVGPFWRRSTASVVCATCYIGRVVPIVLVRFDPRFAVTVGSRPSGRAAREIEDLREIREARFPRSRASNRPGYRAGLRSYGGEELRTFGVGLMALASSLSVLSGQVIAIGVLAFGAVPVSAQSDDDLFGIQKRYIAKKMIPVCTSGSLTRTFVLEIFGHFPTRTLHDDESRAEEALAEELASKTNITVKSAQWEGTVRSGWCHLDLEVTLPPDYVARLGKQTILRGDMWFNLEAQEAGWKLIGITDYKGNGANSFRRFLAPHTDAIVQTRLAQANADRLAAAEREYAGTKAAEKQRNDQAAATRRAWIKKHPAEYAAQQRADANRRAAQAADERRRRLACEAHGGTWGQRITEPYPACFFRSDR